MISIEQYFDLSIAHRKTHKCGGYPFENGPFLTKISSTLKSKRVLEIGTGIGYSAYCFAIENDDVKIDSIDMLKEHSEIAEKYWGKYGLTGRIKCLVGKSTTILNQLVKEAEKKYDIIFFDGFTPNPDEVSNFVKLLSPDGLLITTNLTLASEILRIDEYLQNITNEGLLTKQFEDTAFSSRNLSILQTAADLWNLNSI